MVIKKLKERIKSLSGNMKEDKIKKELEEIKTINILLNHRVTKLIAENEHLKQTYKQLDDSIKSSRIRSKEQCDDLINQVNLKSDENSDLNARLQDKVLRPTGRTFTKVGNAFPLTRFTTTAKVHLRKPIAIESNTAKLVCMSTRSNSSHLFSPLRDPESLIRRKNLGEPSSFFDFEEVMNNNQNQEPPPQNGPPPMVRPNGQALKTMEKLCDDANRHIDKFLEITQYMKQNGVSDDALRLSLFPYSLTHHAIACHRDTINATPGGTFMQKIPEECYKLIENMTTHHNNCDTSPIRDETSRNISSTSTTESPEVVRQLEMMNKNFSKMMRQFQMIKVVDTKCETCGCPHSFTECPAVDGYNKETAYATPGNYNSGGMGSLPSNTVPNPQEDLKAITTRSGVTLAGPLPSPASTSFSTISFPKMPEVTKDTVQPKKLFHFATTLLNENYSAVILKKLPEKLGDPGKFLIPCDFPKFDECLTLENLGVNINLMPFFIWKKLSLPELTSTQMILELADRSTTRPASIAEDVFVKVGKFYFPIDFVVVDYVVNPRVLLILWRPFLRTERALIDVYGEELTLCVDDEAITFKVGQTSKYSYNDAESINRIDVIDVACEEYVQGVLRFSNNSKSGNPIPISVPIVALSSPSLTPFEGGDFILAEIEACLTSKSIPPEIDDIDLDLEGDIRLLEELLNNDPSLSPLPPKELNVKEIKTVNSSIDEP
uniref:Reverse transcriptase domain-containing protein n=1 Tax=Tanacetum cinerariifolium TaxID=118510 RepID=A0A6L2MSD8_TANCI|nr:reverse transcriptase domain-containing protein [Tanacetum cinerariifolium]